VVARSVILLSASSQWVVRVDEGTSGRGGAASCPDFGVSDRHLTRGAGTVDRWRSMNTVEHVVDIR
jgi:hypothetical protein